MLTLEEIKKDQVVDTFIRKSNEHLGKMGYTEHGYRHLNLVSSIAKNILEKLKYTNREVELAAIAGYIHDLGNVVSRYNHGQTGAALCFDILTRLCMHPEDIATVISAVGNHEEQYGEAVNNVAAALILADKADVHRSRVRNQDFATFDIHDRVNYAVEHSFLRVDEELKRITLDITIDINVSSVMEYFEIFLSRMVMCRRAAAFLNSEFGLEINGAKLL